MSNYSIAEVSLLLTQTRREIESNRLRLSYLNKEIQKGNIKKWSVDMHLPAISQKRLKFRAKQYQRMIDKKQNEEKS